MFESPLRAAFISEDRQTSELHLLEERQHHTSVQCSSQEVFETPDTWYSLEYRRIPNGNRWVFRSREVSGECRFPPDRVVEMKSAIRPFRPVPGTLAPLLRQQFTDHQTLSPR